MKINNNVPRKIKGFYEVHIEKTIKTIYVSLKSDNSLSHHGLSKLVDAINLVQC